MTIMLACFRSWSTKHAVSGFSTNNAFIASICNKPHHINSRRRIFSLSCTIDEQKTEPSSMILERRIEDLTNHPAVVWNTTSTFASMHKKKLVRRHLPLFDRPHNNDGQDILFDEFAKAVCNAGVVARKEVFETWASALYIHNHFFCNPNIGKPLRRVADIAAGHGLLAWALLILDDEHRRTYPTNPEINGSMPLTVFCLDVQMPPSAELIQSAMIQQFPYLEKRFDYVEGRLEQLVPHISCLLAGVHACGTLSDVLVATAAEHGVSLALVPCCHSRKAKVLQACASPYAKEEYDAIVNTKGKIPNLADRLDEARIVALKNAGMNVEEAAIPKLFTDKNRLIMASPSECWKESTSSLIPGTPSQINEKLGERIQMGQMPPLNGLADEITAVNPKARYMRGFSVPCKDDDASREIVSKIAGRVAALRRKEVMHNRNHNEAPQLDVSMWLPDDGSDITEQALSKVVRTSNPHVQCSVSKLEGVYTDIKTKRRAQTFRIEYRAEKKVLSFDAANKIHSELRDTIPVVFPGAKCR